MDDLRQQEETMLAASIKDGVRVRGPSLFNLAAVAILLTVLLIGLLTHLFLLPTNHCGTPDEGDTLSRPSHLELLVLCGLSAYRPCRSPRPR